MRLKLDENLPESLLAALTALGHEVDNVRLEGLVGRADPEVWQCAQKAERFLMTQDLDFSDIRTFSPGTHPGLMLVRLRVPGRQALVIELLQCSVIVNPNSGLGALCFSRTTNCAFTDRQSNHLSPPVTWTRRHPAV